MLCPQCRARKAKRACPALGETICAVCCATKRLTTIACPADCVYLGASYRHPPAAVRRQRDQDVTVLMGALGPLNEGQLEMFFVIQHFISGFKPAATTPLVDADVASAVGALATSLETSARGVIYEQPSQSSLAEDLRRGLKTLIAEVGRGGGTRFETEVAIVLRGIERAASHQVKEIGAGPRDYLKLASRLVHPQTADTESPSLIIRP